MSRRAGPSWPAALAALLAAAQPAAGQSSLQVAADSVTAAWHRGDVAAVAAWMPEDGIEIHVGTESHPTLNLRQARAVLARVLADRGSGQAVKGRVEAQEGPPLGGFVEIHWRPADPELRAGHTVFVGFLEREGRWRISEVRVLPAG
jgi:hypothetical protein